MRIGITTELVEDFLDDLMSETELIHGKWTDSKYFAFKQAGATTKGDLAEDLLMAILKESKVSRFRPEGRRDHYDVLMSKTKYTRREFADLAGRNGTRTINEKARDARKLLRDYPDIKAVEVKCATEDVNGSFQFNGLRTDSHYTHCFLLGVAPNTLYFRFVQKKELDGPLYPLVSMQAGANASFKLTRRIGTIENGGLLDFDSFDEVVREVLEQE